MTSVEGPSFNDNNSLLSQFVYESDNNSDNGSDSNESDIDIN